MVRGRGASVRSDGTEKSGSSSGKSLNFGCSRSESQVPKRLRRCAWGLACSASASGVSAASCTEASRVGLSNSSRGEGRASQLSGALSACGSSGTRSAGASGAGAVSGRGSSAGSGTGSGMGSGAGSTAAGNSSSRLGSGSVSIRAPRPGPFRVSAEGIVTGAEVPVSGAAAGSASCKGAAVSIRFVRADRSRRSGSAGVGDSGTSSRGAAGASPLNGS